MSNESCDTQSVEERILKFLSIDCLLGRELINKDAYVERVQQEELNEEELERYFK